MTWRHRDGFLANDAATCLAVHPGRNNAQKRRGKLSFRRRLSESPGKGGWIRLSQTSSNLLDRHTAVPVRTVR